MTSDVGYVWPAMRGHFYVAPPKHAYTEWRAWLSRQDASLRSYVADPVPGYWLMDERARKDVMERFIQCGWVLSYEIPSFILHGKTGTGHGASFAREMVLEEAFSELFLLPTAPIEVVKSSYRALQKMYHPDRPKGDKVRSGKITDAYKVILKEKEWK